MQSASGHGSAFELLSEWAGSNRVFKRNRRPPGSKLLAAALCASGYSYRDVAALLGGISYIAVRDAFLAVSSFCSDDRKVRRVVAIDESTVRVGDKDAYFWLARDVDSGETLSFRCSFGASPEDCAEFYMSILRRCQNRPAVRLGKGANYPKGLKNLGLQFEVGSQPSSGITSLLRKFFLPGRTLK